MKVPLSWLRELAESELAASELAARLTAAGTEVEGIEERGRELDGIVVGEIVQVDPHPSADRLVVCQVRIAADRVETIVCGARNMKAGDRVAVATPGTRLPDGRAIGTAEIRGVLSHGMLCSEKELGLGEDHEGILILPAGVEVGLPLAQVLTISDTVFEINLTPNRGDCLSVLGIARELAAVQAAKLVRSRSPLREKGEPAENLIAVHIADPELCWRYAARVVTGLRLGPSPAWMQQRLLASGMRPINNLVDVTNYVMLERGQPLHAFDLRQLPAPEITVRRAGASQRFTLLDGSEKDLAANDLVITSGGEPVAIAGVMGGLRSGVSDGTHTVLLESAWFQPTSVRRTSRRLGLSTESSYRFERNVDIEGVVPAIDRAAALLVRVAGGVAAPGVVDVYPRPHRPAPVHVRVQRVGEILGIPVERARVVSTLKAVGAVVSAAPGGSLSVVPPSHRSDLTREIDFIEEVARLIGMEEIPTTMPTTGVLAGDEGPVRPVLRDLRGVLTALGWCETVPWSFASERANAIFTGITPAQSTPVVLLNPLAQDLPQMRRSLLPGLADSARLNANQGESAIAIFCSGKAFWRESGSEAEGLRFAGLLCGQPPRKGIGLSPAEADFLDVKGVVENLLARFSVAVEWSPAQDLPFLHPGAAARIRLDEFTIGMAGELHPDLVASYELPGRTLAFELDLDTLLEYPPRRSFRELPRFPAVTRDLAILVEEGFAAAEVIRFVREWGNEWIETVDVFDQYHGAQIPPGKKSLAFSIVYRAAERTLTDEEVNSVHERLTEALTKSLGVEMRR